MLWILFFAFTITLNTASNDLFYIYDTKGWPEVATASIYKRDVNERLENQMNFGAGPLVNVSQGAYHTDQYQLFSMIYYRALKDPRRTLDPSKATSFIIPYDFASDSAYYKNCARSHGVCYDFRKCPLAPTVETLLNDSTWFHRNKGKDHVLIVGMNYAMDHYILKPKCKSLIAGKCTNCTKFAIDDYSYMYSGNHGIISRGDYWHAIPFPADFHWSKDVNKPFPWEETRRPFLASYTGSEKSFYGPSRRLRQSIGHYCGKHLEDCNQKSYGLNGTRFSFKVDGYHPLHASQSSVFCFQPTGDLMTRKGLFDSILQGCIPVVFDPLTASVMYTWHWEETFWKEVIVELPAHPVAFRYLDPILELKKLTIHNTSLIAHKQHLIRSRVFELQYSLDGRQELYQYTSPLQYIHVRPTNETSVAAGDAKKSEVRYEVRDSHGKTTEHISYQESNWPKDSSGKPMRDAYDIVIDYIFGWHSGRLIRARNATVPECWDGWLDTTQNRCRPGKEPGKN